MTPLPSQLPGFALDPLGTLQVLRPLLKTLIRPYSSLTSDIQSCLQNFEPPLIPNPGSVLLCDFYYDKLAYSVFQSWIYNQIVIIYYYEHVL